MTFLNPGFFWAFLSLIPLLAVYFLKVRPRRKPATAYFLWEEIFREKRSTSLLRRLRDFLSLLLMALAFSAVVLALAKPQWTGDERRDMLIVIDHSASMSAREGDTTRLELAKRTAADIVRAFNSAQRAAVATLGSDLVFHSHLSDNPRALLDAIKSVESSAHELRPEAFARSPSSADWSREHRVILLTDGCFDTDTLPDHVELLKVGEFRENTGIVAADMRYIPGAGRRLGFYFQVASTHRNVIQADLLVSRTDAEGGESLMRLVPLEISPGINGSQVLTLEDAEPGRWAARLDVDDALATDDVAWLSVEAPRPIRVAVESNDRFFLENSVIAFSRSAGLLTLTDSSPQIVLSKSVTPDADNVLIFQPDGESPWWTDPGEETLAVAPRVLVDEHPALRFLDATSIPFVGARPLNTPDGAQILVASDDGIPLIYRAAQGDRRAVVVNMDPVAAEFYFSAWFPVLVHSVSTWLAGRETPHLSSYRSNSIVTVPGVQSGETTQVVDPSGETVEVHSRKLPPLDRPGFYQLTNSGGEWLVACSLLSSVETLLDNTEARDTSRPISRGWAPADLLILLAIVALGTESLLYHRRKVG